MHIEIARDFIKGFKEFNKNINLSTANIYLDDHVFKQKIYGFYGYAIFEEKKVSYSRYYPLDDELPIDIEKYKKMAEDIQQVVRGYELPMWNGVLGAAILDNRKILKGKF